LTRNKNGLSTAFSISSSIGITCPTPIIIRRRRRRRSIHVSISEQQTSSLQSSNSFNDIDSNLDSNDKYKDNTDNSTFIVHHQQQLLHQEERQRQGQKSPITISLFDQSISSSSSNSSSSLSLNSSSSSSTNSSSSSLSLSEEQQQQQRRNHPLLSLNLNLDSLAQVGAGNLAQELLRRIQALYVEGYYQISPDIVSYNSVLKAWKEQDNPQQALELLESMIQEEIEEAARVVVVDDDDEEATGGDDDDDEAIKNGTSTNNNISRPIRVDVISFNTVIAAFANQGNYNKALELLRRMQQYDNDNNNNDDVNENDNDRKALELLRRMQQQGGDDDDVNDNKVKNTNNTNRNKNRTMYHYYPNPDTTTYNIVLYSLAQSDDCGTAEQAENLLREMMTTGLSYVDTTSFNTVLYAWSKEGVSIDNNNNFNSNNNAKKKSTKNTKIRNNNNSNSVSKKIAAQRAEDLLTIMEALSEAEGNSHILPDVYSYTTVIQCWAKCLRPDMAQDVFNQMTIDRGLQPNKLTYTALINALSKSGQPELAEQVLHQMIENNEDDDDEDNNNENNILPDTVTFSSVIDGWSRVASKDRPEAAARALHILETMKNHAAEGMGPNARTYTSVLTALAKSGTWDACEKAKNLVQYMEEVYNNSTDDALSSSSSSSLPGASLPNNNNNNDDKWSMRPTNIHYNCLLNAYARSPQADKGIKAEVIIKEMENHPRLDCRPDTISYK
jgi:pentatricopeptide repeat protein